MAGQVACGNKPRKNAKPAEISADLHDTTCRACRAQLGIDDSTDASPRLEALFVLSITLGLRPGELRALTWDHVDLDHGVIHVWHSTRRDGDTKTPKSRRSLVLPRGAIDALQVHRARQGAERLTAGVGMARRQPCLLPRRRAPVQQRRAQLAVRQDDQASWHRPLART
jgi:integrase